MKKSFKFLFVAFALVTSLFVSCSGGSDNANVIKLGFIGPLTGDYANYGTYCRDAALLAVKEFNETEASKLGYTFEIVDIDSAADNNKALAAVEKLSSDKRVMGIAGPVITSETFVVAERCQNEGLTIISPSATHKDITSIGDYIFRTVISDGLQGEVAGAYFAQKLGLKKIAVLYTVNDYSQGLYEGMKASFEKNPGCQIVAAETCNIGDKDFRSQLTRIRSTDAEAIYIPNYTEEMAQILEQAAQLGITLPFVSGDGFSNPVIYELAGNYTEGVIYVAPPQVKETPLYANFVAAYTEEYGHAPDSFATNMYDGTNVYIEAVKRLKAEGKEVTRESLRDSVAATKDFVGAAGVINFASNGDLIADQGVYKVENKKPVFLGAYKVINGKIVDAE